jgi:heptosyltransferase-3
LPPDVTICDRSTILKILAIQFRYLGDTALMTHALRAIREHFPGSALHVLVAEEAVPLLQHLPGLARVWAFPRRRGKAKPLLSWPVIRALRQERFDRSVDFGGNDRGAIVSLLCGARQRLGPLWPGGFPGRRFCYTYAQKMQFGGHQSPTNLQILSGWGNATPKYPRVEIYADRGLAKVAEQLFPRPTIICAAQRLSAIVHENLIVFLDRDHIIEAARYDELVRCSSGYKSLYKLQFAS